MCLRIKKPQKKKMWFISWLILVCSGIVFRTSKAILLWLYYTLFRKNPFDDLGSIQNVVFVGGFLSFIPSETPFIHYWGCLNDRLAWSPMIGPLSSMSDRACELFYSVFGKSTDN